MKNYCTACLITWLCLVSVLLIVLLFARCQSAAPSSVSGPGAQLDLVDRVAQLEDKVGSDFPDEESRCMSELAAVSTVIITILALVGTFLGILAALNYFPNLEKRMIEAAQNEGAKSVDQLEEYFEARIAYASSVSLANVGWNWSDGTYAPTVLKDSVIQMFYYRATEALTRFRKLVANPKTSEAYVKEGQLLLGSVLSNLIFFTCKEGLAKDAFTVADWALELRKQDDFEERPPLFHVEIYAHIIYPEAFASRLNTTPKAIIDVAQQNLTNEKNKGKSLERDDQAEIERLQLVLDKRKKGEAAT